VAYQRETRPSTWRVWLDPHRLLERATIRRQPAYGDSAGSKSRVRCAPNPHSLLDDAGPGLNARESGGTDELLLSIRADQASIGSSMTCRW